MPTRRRAAAIAACAWCDALFAMTDPVAAATAAPRGALIAHDGTVADPVIAASGFAAVMPIFDPAGRGRLCALRHRMLDVMLDHVVQQGEGPIPHSARRAPSMPKRRYSISHRWR